MKKYSRQIDSLGRVVLPAELLREIGVEKGGNVCIIEEGNRMIIEAEKLVCKLCGSSEGLNQNLQICSACIRKVKELE